MSEITAENINNLICNEVSQHMEQVNRAEEIVKIRRARTEKQKENDVKLKDRLTEYHKKKKEAKEELVRMKHINDTLNELNKVEELSKEIDEEEEIAIIYEYPIIVPPPFPKKQIYYNEVSKEEYPSFAPQIIKKHKGRPKKVKPSSNDIKEFHIYPGPENPKDEICCSSN